MFGEVAEGSNALIFGLCGSFLLVLGAEYLIDSGLEKTVVYLVGLCGDLLIWHDKLTVLLGIAEVGVDDTAKVCIAALIVLDVMYEDISHHIVAVEAE